MIGKPAWLASGRPVASRLMANQARELTAHRLEEYNKLILHIRRHGNDGSVHFVRHHGHYYSITWYQQCGGEIHDSNKPSLARNFFSRPRHDASF